MSKELTITLLLVWALSGVSSIALVAIQEKRRLGGKLFSHIIEDLKDFPFVATFGYMLTFIGSWLTFFNKILIEKNDQKKT
ncbi:MAG: hypothetical protein KBC21_01150 [Candidatus Pacebacteria bacterium]|nr:hypothetical protein [Candidatus Paceibacterota bacterium]